MSEILLEMRRIRKEFSGVAALDDVNLVVKAGEIHALCGENGAGKSTLMNVLSGLYPYGQYSGEIIYEGKECRLFSIRDSEKKGIVIISQELALSPYLSIAENLFLGNERTSLKGVIDWNATRSHAIGVLKTVGLGNEDVDTPVHKLGVGKQQLIEIAKALGKKAKLLILDEPTAALNDEDSNKLLDLLLELKRRGITSIMISHKLHEVSRIADSITIIRDGKTIETIVKDEQGLDENRIIRGMVGRELVDRFPPRESRIGEVVLEVRNWNVYHPDDSNRKVLHDIHLHVRKGEVVGLAGLMGAGRTELAMSLFGRAYGQKITGEIYKNGRQLHLRSIDDAIRNGIVYVTEDRKSHGLVLIKDVRWNMTLANIKQYARHGIIDNNEEALAAAHYFAKMNIKARDMEQEVISLSGGNQQKVLLSKWIMALPEVLILDEPTRGIDVGAKFEIYGIINRLVAEGKAVMVISSDMSELLGISDRIYVVNEGEMAGEFTRADVSMEGIMTAIVTHSARRKTV